MKSHLVKTLYVEAAHTNPRGGPAQRRLHGHSYRVDILASGTVDDGIGWIVDFAELKRAFGDLYAQLDHHCFDEVSGLEDDSTLPALKAWIEARLKPRLDWIEGVRVGIVGDLEYRPVRVPACAFEGLPERIRFSFEAAQSLPQLPCGHPCRNIHGHSYRIEIAGDDLDGIARDARAVHDALDHRYLNEVSGLERSTVEVIARWIRAALESRGHRIGAVVVQETPSSHCLDFGE